MAFLLYLPYTLIAADGTTTARSAPTVDELPLYPALNADNVILTSSVGNYPAGAYQWNPIRGRWQYIFDYPTICSAFFAIASAYIILPATGATLLPIGDSGNATVVVTRNGSAFTNFTLNSSGIVLGIPATLGDIYFVAQESPLKPATLITPGGITDAPNNNLAYVRKNSAWALLTSQLTGYAQSVNGQVPDGTGNVSLTFSNIINAPTAAAPSTLVGPVAIAGSSNTYMRADAAPAINLAANYIWSGGHTFGSVTTFNSIPTSTATQPVLTDSSTKIPTTAWVQGVVAGSVVQSANPSTSVGLSAVNGSASTFMRSDAAPALSQTISPTWASIHTFAAGATFGIASSVQFGNGFTITGGTADLSSSANVFVPTVPTATNDTHAASAAFVYAVAAAQGASPTAQVGPTVVNGTANTYMRSDAAPPVNLSATYNWAGVHSFGAGLNNTATQPAASDSTTWVPTTAWAQGAISARAANPTAQAGPTAVNGVATTFMRSDGAPAINQGANYSWTGTHGFSNNVTNTVVQPASSDSTTWVPTTAWVQGAIGARANSPSANVGLVAVNGSATTFMRSDAAPALSQAIMPIWTALHTFNIRPVFNGNTPWDSGNLSAANPTASVGLTAVNGSATTFMRSDGAPALSQAIVPTWTGVHSFSAIPQSTATQPASTDSSNNVPNTSWVQGAIKQHAARTVTTGTGTVSNADYFVGVNFAGTVAIALNAGSTFAQGQEVTIKDESGAAASNKNITITANGTDKIDGQSVAILALNYGSLTLIWNTNHWSIK